MSQLPVPASSPSGPGGLPPIPRPVPMGEQPIPPVPPQYALKPSATEVVVAQPGTSLIVAVITKRTYRFKHNQPPTLAELQHPLAKQDVRHKPLVEPLPDEEPPRCSMLRVPEVFARRPGTDVLVHGSALPRAGATSMRVGVQVGKRVYGATITGDRTAVREGGGVRFTDPKPIEKLPLRHELAFGGLDGPAGQRFLNGVQEEIGLMAFRRTATFLRQRFVKAAPFSYARNPYGLGYVTDPAQWPELAKGGPEPLSLPNIERVGDELTPERLGNNGAMVWHTLPIPALFGPMDASMFPRSAMAGLPPVFLVPPDEMPEVAQGLVTKGYCPGSFFNVNPEDLPKLFNPDIARTAPLGLRFDYLRPGELITLSGMGGPGHDDTGALALLLPREVPEMVIPGAGPGGAQAPMAELELQQVRIDVDAGEVEVLWAGIAPLSRQPSVEQVLSWRDAARVQWRNV